MWYYRPISPPPSRQSEHFDYLLPSFEAVSAVATVDITDITDDFHLGLCHPLLSQSFILRHPPTSFHFNNTSQKFQMMPPVYAIGHVLFMSTLSSQKESGKWRMDPEWAMCQLLNCGSDFIKVRLGPGTLCCNACSWTDVSLNSNSNCVPVQLGAYSTKNPQTQAHCELTRTKAWKQRWCCTHCTQCHQRAGQTTEATPRA